LAIEAPISRNQRAEKVIGFLGLTPECFNKDSVITTNLNQVRMLFAGVLNEVGGATKASASPPADANQPAEAKEAEAAPQITRTPLVMTTAHGNAWHVSSSFEIMFPDPAKLMDSFIDGTKPVVMGYLATGRFKTSFPDGIEVEIPATDPNTADKADDPNAPKMVKQHLTGLTQAQEDCAVVVFSDVDFLTDQLAYAPSFFGKMVVGDNGALLLNTVEELGGSGDLISIRSRGNFKRPFVVIDEIERQAERETAKETAVINAQIDGFNAELQKLVSSADDQEKQEVLGSAIVQKKRDLEIKIREAQRQLRDIKAQQRERIDEVGRKLELANMAAVPSVVMLLAVVLGLWRSVRRRRYISHTSDA
jgi:ABC-2 type transport system permease protein